MAFMTLRGSLVGDVKEPEVGEGESRFISRFRLVLQGSDACCRPGARDSVRVCSSFVFGRP